MNVQSAARAMRTVCLFGTAVATIGFAAACGSPSGGGGAGSDLENLAFHVPGTNRLLDGR